jgi:hypothetical protein
LARLQVHEHRGEHEQGREDPSPFITRKVSITRRRCTRCPSPRRP